MQQPKPVFDIPLLLLAGLSVATVYQLAGVLAAIPWLAAGTVVVPVLAASAFIQYSRTTPAQPPLPLRSAGEDRFPSAETEVSASQSSAEQFAAKNIPAIDHDDDETGPEQSLRIWRDASGQEAIAGELQINFSPGVRTTVAHIPWQPRLLKRAVAAVEVIDGDDVEVRVDLLRPYGMRLVARRSGNLEDFTTCRVEYYVAENQAAAAAA